MCMRVTRVATRVHSTGTTSRVSWSRALQRLYRLSTLQKAVKFPSNKLKKAFTSYSIMPYSRCPLLPVGHAVGILAAHSGRARSNFHGPFNRLRPRFEARNPRWSYTYPPYTVGATPNPENLSDSRLLT